MRLCFACVVTPRLTRAMSRYSLVEAVGRPELDARRIGVGKHGGTAVLADIFGVVADQAVALSGDAALDLAGGRELEALLDAALGLQLGHFRLLFESDQVQPRQPISAGRFVRNRYEGRAYRQVRHIRQPLY